MEKTLEQRPSNCIKIVLYGPESTGKTSLSKRLAKHYNTEWVPEYARKYLQEKYDKTGKICEEKDLIPIAQGQIENENKLSKKAHKILFCDTNVLQTYFYGKAYYCNFNNQILKKYAYKHTYDLYFLTYIDTPWEADDLRDKPNEREEMYQLFKKSLEEQSTPFYILKGDEEMRFNKAVEVINQLMKNQ